MKLKFVFFSTVFFLLVNGVFSQPQCNKPFNPFYICQSNFERYEYLFYGEVVSIEPLVNVSVNNTYPPLKAIVEVKNSFKGKLPQKITLYLSANLICSIPSKGNRYLFSAIKSELDDQKVYFSERMSRPMTGYSKKAVKDVSSNICSILENKKKDYVEGTIFESLLQTREVTIKAERADRLSRDFKYRKPIADIKIKAISESDGKMYQTKSKADGKFRIDRIPNGVYKVNLYSPFGKKQVRSFRYRIDDTFCSRIWLVPFKPEPSN